MPRRYPTLTPDDVARILKAAGFAHQRTKGSHQQWEHENYNGQPRHVTVDTAYPEFNKDRILTMINQAGMTRDEFYCQTAKTARRINKQAIRRA